MTVEAGAFSPWVTADLVNKRNSEAHKENAAKLRALLHETYTGKERNYDDLARALSATALEKFLGLRLVLEGDGFNDPAPKEDEKSILTEDLKLKDATGESKPYKLVFYGGTVWQLAMSWCTENSTQTGGGDVVRDASLCVGARLIEQGFITMYPHTPHTNHHDFPGDNGRPAPRRRA